MSPVFLRGLKAGGGGLGSKNNKGESFFFVHFQQQIYIKSSPRPLIPQSKWL